MHPFRWALASYWTWLIYLAVISPFNLAGLLLQHLWILLTATFRGLQELRLGWQQELRPLWLSYFELYTRATHKRARSLFRHGVRYSRA